MRARPASLLVALVALVALLAGCGGDDDEDTTTAATTTTTTEGAPSGGGATALKPGVYVGEVRGTGASIALVSDGDRLSGAYLCIPQSTSQWIKPAPLKNGKTLLVARRGTLLGSAKFAGSSATGSIKAGGTNSYTAKLASGDAGLYRTTSGNANQPGFSETGWIVLPDGSDCGSTNSITSGGGFESKPASSGPQGQITDFSDPFPF